nr:hypothetical protein [Pseudobdellovibrionaceae bacterium]
YSLFNTFTNSCAAPASNCISSCSQLQNAPDTVGADAKVKLKSCLGYQNKIAEYQRDGQRLGSAIQSATLCSQMSSTNFNFASLSCTGAAASTPECVCKASADPQGCLMQYLSQKGNSGSNSNKGFSTPEMASAASTASTKDSGFKYEETPDKFTGVDPSLFKNNGGDNQPGRLGGGSIGSPNGGGGLTGGGDSGGGGGGSYDPNAGSSVGLNKGYVPPGAAPGSGGFRPSSLGHAVGMYKPGSPTLGANNPGVQTPDFSKYNPNLAVRYPSDTSALYTRDGVQGAHEPIFKVMQKGYRNSDSRNYFYTK